MNRTQQPSNGLNQEVNDHARTGRVATRQANDWDWSQHNSDSEWRDTEFECASLACNTCLTTTPTMLPSDVLMDGLSNNPSAGPTIARLGRGGGGGGGADGWIYY